MRPNEARETVDRILAAAPDGSSLPESDVLGWTRMPLVQELRAAVRSEDRDKLIGLLPNGSTLIVKLTIVLLRALRSDPRVRQQFVDLWRDKQRPLEERLWVMYPLLDYEDLDPELITELFSTVMDNWSEFAAVVPGYFPSADTILEVTRERLLDPTWPTSKRWIYLCNAMCSPDAEGARTLVQSYLDDPDPFTRQVASSLLLRA